MELSGKEIIREQLIEKYGHDIARIYFNKQQEIEQLQKDIEEFNSILGIISIKRLSYMEMEKEKQKLFDKFCKEFPIK